jgi:hypothetical protein
VVGSLVSIKYAKFLDKLSYHELPTNESASWSYEVLVSVAEH